MCYLAQVLQNSLRTTQNAMDYTKNLVTYCSRVVTWFYDCFAIPTSPSADDGHAGEAARLAGPAERAHDGTAASLFMKSFVGFHN